MYSLQYFDEIKDTVSQEEMDEQSGFKNEIN